MNASQLRASLRQFAGADRYSQFVRKLNRPAGRTGPLRYWQEQLWADFLSATPGVELSAEQIRTAFCVCDIHDCSLAPPPSDEPLSEVRDTPEYARAMEELFPFAVNGGAVCLECCNARANWVADHPDLCQVLRCKTTYEEYCKRRIPGLCDEPEIKDKIAKRSAEIAEMMKPGDELWEWDAGGWNQLSGRAGVAIVRDGKVLQQWCEMRS